MGGRDLLSKPLYFCDLKNAGADSAENRQKLEALRAALDFLRNGNKLAAMVEQGVDADAARCYAQLQAGVEAARTELQRRLMMQAAVAGDIADSRTLLGRFAAVAKRMSEVSANISDAYRLALDGDKAGDQGRKLTFRSQLQQSLMLCAEALLAGDECVTDLAREWNIQPATQTTAPVSTTVQPQLAVPPPRPQEMSASRIAPEARAEVADITISCSAPVSILPLTVGQFTKQDTNGARPFRSISPELIGWKIVSVTQHSNNSYVIRVNRDGFLYAFGSAKKTTVQEFLGTEETSQWEAADDAIVSAAVKRCLRRKVIAGDVIKIMGNALQLAAKSIELVRDGKATPTFTPSPATGTVVATAASIPDSKAVGAAITISCSVPVHILPLETRQPTMDDGGSSRFLKGVSKELSGWQFVALPENSMVSYEMRVNQAAVLYLFGLGPKNWSPNILGPDHIGLWEAAEGAIRGPTVRHCHLRKVAAGETIKLSGQGLQLAAESINLVKSESTTLPAAPATGSSAIIPVATGAPDSSEVSAAITITCSNEVRILPLEAGQNAFYDLLQGGRAISRIDPSLSGWQFVAVGKGKNEFYAYEIHANQDGELYASGGTDARNISVRKFLGTEDISAWEESNDSIHGAGVARCMRRKMTAGESIKLEGERLELAAKSIELLRDWK